MKNLVWALGLVLWAVLVFFATFFLTFPSEAISQRIRYEIPTLMGEGYTAEIGSVSPWWVGLSVSDVKLYHEEQGRPRSVSDDEEGEASEGGAQLVGLFEHVKVRVSLWSLLRRAPYVSGLVGLPGGDIHFSVGTAADEDGEIGLADLVIQADDLPLEDLMMLASSVPASGTGPIDIDIDLHAGSNGMRDATGRISIGGRNLELTDVELPDMGNLGMAIPISELLLMADVVDGKATLTDAHLDSEFAKVKATGELTLRDPIDRTGMDLKITLSNLGGPFQMASGFLGDAKQADGSFLYTCKGVIARMSARSCSAGERTVTTREPGERPMRSPRGADASSDPDRERRREEIRERLRQRREERQAERAGAVPVTPPSDLDDPEGDDEDVEIIDDPEGDEGDEIPEDHLPE